MFKKILIANRGEIAVRIIRACKELGIKTVAVYSEIDKNSMHVRLADESICIGPAESAKSYLNIPAIISAAEIADADAIHPGYGFLAENPKFAEICNTCNIKFIGPTPENIELMGNKIKAKQILKESKIPLIPGSIKNVETEEEALSIAKDIGFPIIIKASAGGGGKGMRIVNNERELLNSFYIAQSEAMAFFGSSEIYIEKYIKNPKHVEFQIMADEFGNVIFLPERDCTIQRKYQKILEETPCPLVDETLRKKMGEVAIKVAKAINYKNLGTVEFLLDENKNFYFIEMNTRIQVEHPITEMITGIDLVKEQILLSMGEKLKYNQDDIKINGHAIECRINAENPWENFSPSPGKINFLYLPGGFGIRVDTHIYSGYTIPPYYDSLIAKLISHDKCRDLAIEKMKRALSEFLIEGVFTTIPLHKEILENEIFRSGSYSTDFLEKNIFKMRNSDYIMY